MRKCLAKIPASPLLWLCACALLLALACASRAEAPAPEGYPKKITFRNIMKNQDIALGEVEAIIQDYQGFMWLGGRNALLRYDGYDFLNVPIADNPADTTQLSGVNQIIDLLEDSRHNLWAASRSGIYKYDRERELLLPLLDAQGKPIVQGVAYALAESPTGELLVGSGYGLYIINTLSLQSRLINHQTDNPNSLPSNVVSDVYVDPQGRLWLGVDEGLVRMDWSSQQLQLLSLSDAASVTNSGVRTIASDHAGNIWAGTVNGIYRVTPNTGAIKHYQHDPNDAHSLGGNITRHIYVDHNGWVWTGSDNGGISLYDQAKDRFQRYEYQKESPGTLSSNTIRRIYEDDTGDIWVGTYPSGVNLYDRSTDAIRTYRHESGLSHGLLDNDVEAVEEDRDGNLWLGAGGITRYDPANETFTHYMHTEGKDSRAPSGSVLNGVIDSTGSIRFGSWAHGIQTYNPQKDIFEEDPVDTTTTARGETSSDKLNDHMVWSIYEDRQKNLWIGTHFNGLTKFDRQTGRYSFYSHSLTDETTISCPVVWTTFEDSQGRFWVGTAYGLNLMDRAKGTFKRYLPQENSGRGLINSSILTIAEDHKGRVWFGTDMGLHLYHPESDSFSVYSARDGFADQGIRAILEDGDGNLWLGTNNGIVMFNPDTKRVKNYVRYNGEQIGGTATGAAVATRSGEMAFGTRTGLYIFNTKKLLMNEKVPPVVLTDFRIFTQKVPVTSGPDAILTRAITQTDSITLDHTQSMIAFSFAALNYREPEKNQYAYQLEGFDDNWRQVGNQRTALYTNLPAGHYQFHVKASNNDGVWSPQGHSISLTILPPPWRTWWAYGLYLLTILSLLLFFVYIEHRQVVRERKTSRELERKVAERTGELQTKTTELETKTAELQTKNAELGDAYAQLEAISLSDPLTGLSNRRYLQKLMPMDIAKVLREYDSKIAGQPHNIAALDLTFFLLDVDHFKLVNDIYGHAAGDQLLIQFSELLTSVCRDSDFVVRWGGEEFLIVSRFSDREEAFLVAERIRVNMEAHSFTLPNGSRLTKTCSIGFACYPFLQNQPAALSWEQVIDVADQALYAAKKSGRNRSVGLEANSNTTEAMLHQRLSRNLKGMIKNSELRVIAEAPESLQWD